MSIDALLEHNMDVQQIPATPVRDSSGGIVDSDLQWTTVTTGVACAIEPVSASRMADFAIAGQTITHTVYTLQADVKLGQRLKIVDALGTTYLRVATVEPVRMRGGIDTYFEVGAEEIRVI